MKTLVALAVALAATAAQAQPVRYENDVAKQRAAVEAWTTCIADEFVDESEALLRQDFRSESYKRSLDRLAQTRVSRECFQAMPRAYRKIRLGGLPFAGGLAERLIEKDAEPLLMRLSMAVVGTAPDTYGRTDGIAMCMVRGAPHLVAVLFDTPINTGEEVEALAELQPVADACTAGGARIEASPLGMRSMLATAAFRLLAAQETGTDDDDA